MRASPELKAVFLVALTGYGDLQHRREAAAAGFGAHLVKPVTPTATRRRAHAGEPAPAPGARHGEGKVR